MPPIEQISARDFAIKAHGEQKYGTKPYVYHLDAVASILYETFIDKNIDNYSADILINAAYLHDVLEDTKTTYEELRKYFSVNTTELVRAVTDEKGKNRKERKAATYQKIRAYGPWAVAIKLADRIANLEHCIEVGNTNLLQMYLKEQEGFSKARRNDGELTMMWSRLDKLCSTEAVELLTKNSEG